MNKVLITGGAGFIAYHLANLLLNYDYEIDLLDNFTRGVNDDNLINLVTKNTKVKFIDADLLDSNTVKTAGDRYTYIYHLAAMVGVQHVVRAPFDVLTKNYSLLKNAIEIANNQKELKRFVFFSSSEVYSGTLDHYGLEFPTPEITPLTLGDFNEPRTSYMLSKIYGEFLCGYSDLPITTVRPHNFYGPRMGMSHVIPELIKKVLDTDNGEIAVFSINHKRTFCYIDDAVEIIKCLCESAKTIGEIFNIGNDNEEVTINELAIKIIDLCGKDIKIIPMPPTTGSPVRRCPCTKKLNRVINTKIKYDLSYGLMKTYKWYKHNVFNGQGGHAI
jgi:UDP-glucose 4-epimerase